MMVYCYECGEQVAENDVFCPYCGISIQPAVVVTGGKDDDSLSKTVVVQPPPPAVVSESHEEVAEIVASPVNLEEPQAEQPQIRERLVPDIVQSKTEDFSDDVTAENIEMKTDSVEMSSEEIEKELDLAEEAEKSADDELEVMKELFEEDTPETSFSDSPNVLETIEPVEGTLESGEVCADEKTGAPEKFYDTTADDEEATPAPVFASTEGESIENKADEIASPNRLDLGVVSIKEETPEFAAAAENSPSIENSVAEPPIAMPVEELPAAEISPPSRFDSVSIMEKPAAEKTPEKNRTDESLQSPPAVIPSAISAAPEEKPSRSHTTPIVAGSDTDGKNKAKLKPLDEGTVLNNRYEIIRKIGGGGMGAVYLASDKNLGGVLRAVKEMVQSYIEDEQQEKAVSDFKRESLLLTSLDHQSIPTIYDYFFDEKEARFYLVMKYISGGDLAGRLRSAPESRIDELSVTQWAIQIADVLDYLHNRQPPIVYRDLKPANIMVDGNSGRVMLIDFGIARWVNKEEKGVTAVGTMGYAPPELFSGNVEARSDIYSLGSTMFHLLTGADPQSNPLLIFDFQKHPRPRQINPQLSDQMERILMQSVEYNADKRFASAADLRKALEEHQDNLKANRVTFGVKEAPLSAALSEQPVFCGFCGQRIVATDMFCAFCGAKQPLAQHGVHSFSEGYTPTPLTAQLLIIGTNELEQPAFRLEKEDNLVGRRDPMSNIFPEVDLSKFDPQTKISRRHARIWREGSEFMVEDLGSSNGTYILPAVSDAMRLQPRQPQILTNGDKIRLGDTTLHFILG